MNEKTTLLILKMVVYGAGSTLLAILTVIAFRYGLNVINPDGISYMSIADHYANGHWGDALNAYWSPMLSWLISIGILVGLKPVVAYLTINLLASAGIIFASLYIIKKFVTKSRAVSLSVSAAMIIFLLANAFRYITPDILVVLWVVVFALTLGNVWTSKTLTLRGAAIVGLMGATGYFIKLYLLPVFIVSIIVYFVIICYRKKQLLLTIKNTLTYLGISMVTFCIVVSPFVIGLSIKYDKFMIGSAFGFTMTSNSPGGEGLDVLGGPLDIPNDHALSAWEDPTYIDRGSKFKGTVNGYVHMLKHRVDVAPTYISTINSMSPIIIMSPVFIVIFYILYRKKDLNRAKVVAALSTVLFVYMGGYTLIGQSDNQRYLWPMLFLALIIYAAFITLLLDRNLNNNKKGTKAARIILLLIVPILVLVQTNVVLQETLRDTAEGSFYNEIKDTISSDKEFNKNKFVSNKFRYSQSLAFYTNTKTLGSMRMGDKTCDDMKNYGASYYVYIAKSKSIDQVQFPDCLTTSNSIVQGKYTVKVLRLL